MQKETLGLGVIRTSLGRRLGLGEDSIQSLDAEGDGEVDVAGEEEAELVAAAHGDRRRKQI